MPKTKLVIIEGCDRVGKDTLVASLQAAWPGSKSLHWGYPVGENNEAQTAYQQASFTQNMQDWHTDKAANTGGLCIWNRSHIGEYVYGTMYRDSCPENWIPPLENRFLTDDEDAYLILLTADPVFIAQQDDGQSYSARQEDKRKELSLFLSAFQRSSIANKKLIQVHDEHGYYAPELIHQHVINFINS